MRKILLFLLLPTLLLAGNVKVSKPEKFVQPANTIERVSKRTLTSKTFEFDSIGSGRFVAAISIEPWHYLDSTGHFKELNFDAVPDTVSGFTVVRTGKFDLSYNNSGAIRYQKKDALLTITPVFNQANIDIDFNINSNGLKAQYTLKNSSAPAILKWIITANDSLVDQKDKGRGYLKKNGHLRGMISEFAAVDAAQKPVSLVANYKKDTLIVELDTARAMFPIVIDPSIQDTIVAASSGGIASGSQTTWAAAHNTASGTLANEFGTYKNGTTSWQAMRYFASISLKQLPPAIADSARFFFKCATYIGNPITGIVCQGTFTGARAAGWFNDFTGWAASGAYTLTAYSSDSLYISAVDTWYSVKFDATGIAVINAKMALDTLRIAVIDKKDRNNTDPTGLDYTNPSTVQYITIYYYLINPPGLTAVVDSLYGRAILVGQIDSTGSANCTVRGFKYNRKTGDTTTVSEAGSFGTGTYNLVTGSLLRNNWYYWRAFATNPKATSYSAVDSMLTDSTGAGGGKIYVDGRQVNIVR
jgi:hypothetical protein